MLTLLDEQLRCFVVVLENASKSLPGQYGGGLSRACRHRCDEFIAETLMVPFCVIVVDVFGYRYPQMSLTQRYDAVETLPAYRENKSFRICVQIRTLGGKSEGLHPCFLQEPTYFLGEQRIPIMDEVVLALIESLRAASIFFETIQSNPPPRAEGDDSLLWIVVGQKHIGIQQ